MAAPSAGSQEEPAPGPLLPVAHIPQRRRGECLAACAAMVLAYLGRPLAYSRLLQILDIQSDVGAPFSNLQLLERSGITVIYRQGTLAELQRFLVNGWPCIVPVKTYELPYWELVESDHTVVVVGIASHISLSGHLCLFDFDRSTIIVIISAIGITNGLPHRAHRLLVNWYRAHRSQQFVDAITKVPKEPFCHHY